MQPKIFKTVVVGGSNTVMRPGYMSEAIKLGDMAGIEIDIIENLAVGGTTLLNGLYRLINSQHLKDADLLLIEYALNDTPIYADNMHDRQVVTHWARAYEGLLRLARTVNPNIRIVSIILEARTSVQRRRMNLVNAGVHYLSSYYDLEVVDIAAALPRDVGLERAGGFEFYKDSAHYKPAVFKQIGARLVQQLMSPPRVIGPLPEPMDPGHFAHAKALNAADMGLPLKRYANSRFEVDTVELEQNELQMTLTGGKLLAVMYVDERSTGVAHFEAGGKPYACYTLKPAIQSGDFPWLLSMFSCEFLYPKALMRPDTVRNYRISTSPMSATAVKPFRPSANLVNELVDKPTFAIAGLLFTGELEKLHIQAPV
jgi:hypothetical protein